MNEKPLPEPLYSCAICKDDYSWPASDLFWSEKLSGWCCNECWSEVDLHWGEDGKLIDSGVCLADELKRREHVELRKLGNALVWLTEIYEQEQETTPTRPDWLREALGIHYEY